MLSNTDRFITNSKGRKNKKITQLTYLKYHLIGNGSPWFKTIKTYLKEKYPYPVSDRPIL